MCGKKDLRQDPLANKAVPTNRIKKIWEMVEGGAPWNQGYFRVVRDRLDRLGAIHIFDRKHKSGKAWRWEAGADFPEDSWKAQQRKFKENHKQPAGTAVSFEEFMAVKKKEKNNKAHNTLYEKVAGILELRGQFPRVRPPPWQEESL